MCSSEHMPDEPPPNPNTRYRLLAFYPERLDYVSGRVVLTFRADHDGAWIFYAVKENDPTAVCEIMRRPTMLAWAQDRYAGFDVVTGSAADKIMRRLVREGGAVRMAAGETYQPKRERMIRWH